MADKLPDAYVPCRGRRRKRRVSSTPLVAGHASVLPRFRVHRLRQGGVLPHRLPWTVRPETAWQLLRVLQLQPSLGKDGLRRSATARLCVWQAGKGGKTALWGNFWRRGPPGELSGNRPFTALTAPTANCLFR